MIAWISSSLSALFSGLVCALLLLVNGSIIYVLLESFVASQQNWMSADGVVQFILYTAPVAMMVIEWMLLDVAMNILRRAWSETD